MKNTRRTLTAICLALSLFAASVLAARAVDLEFVHFEDGSGKVSWCLPGELCKRP